MAPLRAVFSDLDGTLVHFSKWFEEHGTRIVEMDEGRNYAVVENAAGERRACRLLPSSTMGPGLVSERSVELVAELRREGVLFVVVTAARKSTLLERLPLLPELDVAVAETGSRVYVQGELDAEWAAGLEPVCGPIEREMEIAERPEPLWQLFRKLQRVEGLKVDGRSYYGCFRVDTLGSAEAEERLLAFLASGEVPAGIDWAMNLGKYDFFPAASGKGNVVAYLQRKFGFAPDECAALFDDDNDLPMAARCGQQLLPGITSKSIERAAAENPAWVVAPSAGQGVFAFEECVEALLQRVRSEKSAVV